MTSPPLKTTPGNLVLEFIDYRLDNHPKYTIKECKERDATYAAPLYVTARLINKQTGEVKEQEIFMGDFPLMTDSGTFISNGAERVIVSQLVRSPGVFYASTKDRTGKDLFTATMNPNRGAWLEYETDSSDVFYVRIDKNRKLPVTTFLRALGLGSDDQIRQFFGETDPRSSPRWKRTSPTTPRKVCWNATASCARANPRRWRTPQPTSTPSSLTPAAMTWPASAGQDEQQAGTQRSTVPATRPPPTWSPPSPANCWWPAAKRSAGKRPGRSTPPASAASP